MTDNDIEKIYKELKKVFKGYQEERIRRNVMKDLNAIVEIDFSDDEESQYEFKTQEHKKLRKVMENVELELKKKFDMFEQDKVESLKKLDLEVI